MWFVPNVVGYGRIVLLLYTCFCQIRHHYAAVLWFSVVQFSLDYVDGALARALNQVLPWNIACNAHGRFVFVCHRLQVSGRFSMC